MNETIDKNDPRVIQELDEFAARYGWRFEEVLLPGHWSAIVHDDGRPLLAVNLDGMRALEILSPRPDASEYVEGLIGAIDERWPMS